MTEINDIIERAREKAKANGDPLGKSHIAKYVRDEMDEYKDSYAKGISKKSLRSLLEYESNHPFWTILTWTVLGGIAVALPIAFALVFIGSAIGITNTTVAGVACAAISILLGLLMGVNAVENDDAELRQSAFNNGMSWQNDKVLFEKALNKLEN